MNPLHILIALGVGWAIASSGSKPKADVVPVPALRVGKDQLRSIAEDVEAEANMPGFADFAVGVAQNESRFNNLAIDDSAPAVREAVRGFDNNPGRYGDVAYPRHWYTWGTGGWYQMLPSTALASQEWNKANPMLVFAPVASTVLLASFIQRVQRNHFSKLPPNERSWIAVRRFLRSNRAGLDWREELEGTRGKRIRFGEDLAKNGISPDFMFELVPTNTVRATPDLYRRVLQRRGLSAEDLRTGTKQ